MKLSMFLEDIKRNQEEVVYYCCNHILSKKFDISKNVAFTTYAVFRIKRRLVYFVRGNRAIRIPHWVHDTKDLDMHKKRTGIISLNKMVGEGIEFEELIGKIDPEIELIEHQDQLERLFESLDAKEKYVIVEIYLEKRTLKDIGESLGVCRERVRQIKCSGLQKMRRRGIENGIKFKRFN